MQNNLHCICEKKNCRRFRKAVAKSDYQPCHMFVRIEERFSHKMDFRDNSYLGFSLKVSTRSNFGQNWTKNIYLNEGLLAYIFKVAIIVLYLRKIVFSLNREMRPKKKLIKHIYIYIYNPALSVVNLFAKQGKILLCMLCKI